MRQRYGIAPAARGVLVALASGSSDVAVNTVSAVRGVGQIGLGNLLGSNVVSNPLVVTAAYLTTRSKRIGGADEVRTTAMLAGKTAWRLPSRMDAHCALPHESTSTAGSLVQLPGRADRLRRVRPAQASPGTAGRNRLGGDA